MKKRHEFNTYFVVQQQTWKNQRFLVRGIFLQRKLLPNDHLSSALHQVCDDKNRMSVQIPKKPCGKLSNFLSITSPCPFHPFTRQHVLCNWRMLPPLEASGKKRPLVDFAHRDEMDVQNLEMFFINFFLSTHFKNHGESFSEPLYSI